MKKLFVLRAICGVMLGIVIVSSPKAAVITFDEFINDTSGGGEISGNEYADQGVTFGTPDFELNIGFSNTGPPNGLGANQFDANDFSGTLFIDFLQPVSDLSFTIYNPPFSATAFDIDGNALVTFSSGPDFTQIFDFAGFSVSHVEIAPIIGPLTDRTYAIDDVTFNSTIPIPPALWLFGSGLVLEQA